MYFPQNLSRIHVRRTSLTLVWSTGVQGLILQIRKQLEAIAHDVSPVAMFCSDTRDKFKMNDVKIYKTEPNIIA